MALDSGTRFGRYVIERLIGEGGMGSVYAARDPSLGRRVALKMLRGERIAEPNVRERLLREARAGAALSHPNATTVYEVGEHDGHPYIAMEYLEGKTLRAFVGATDVDIETHLRWLVDIARVLAAAHAAGLVHRDIKPENVMVTRDGVIKVLDFGITRALSGFVDASAPTLASGEDPAKLETITTEGLMIGTPLYMAPEQMLGNPIDGRTDQFAWGVTAYELLAGRVPWSADADPSGGARVVALIVSDRPAPALEAAGVSADVRAVVAKALQKDPERRFASMMDVVEALAPTTGGSKKARLPEREPSQRGDAAVRFDRRTPVRLAMVAVAVAAVIGVIAVARSRSTPIATPAASSAIDAAVTPAPIPTRMTDVPLPPSSNAEALAAYRKGVQALHDADNGRGFVELDRALQLDPALGAASLRLCMFDGRDRRSPCTSARQLRSTLSERDAAMLDVAAPVMFTNAPDYGVAADRAVSLAAQYPGDAEVTLKAAEVLTMAARHADAQAMFAKALALDPTFALAHVFQGVPPATPEQATRSYESCLMISPAAGTCLRGLGRLVAQAGDCVAYEALSRRNVAVEPNGEYALSHRLDALLATGARRADLGPLLGALAESARPTADASSARTRQWLDAAVAAQFGAFDEALAGWSAYGDHRMALLVASEIGVERFAVEHARAVLAESFTPKALDGAIHLPVCYRAETEARALLVLRGSGELTVQAARAKAAVWIDEAQRLSPRECPIAWEISAITGALATTPAELDAALGGRPPPVAWVGAARATLGNAALIGGRLDDAIELLSVVDRSCTVLNVSAGQLDIFARVHARFDLGEARALKGDTAGACALFAQVIAQWGDAKPRSVTAESARKRMAALRCPK